MAPGTPGMTPAAREYQRRRAWELKQAGWKRKHISAALEKELRNSTDMRGPIFNRGVILCEGETELGALPVWFT